MSDKKTIGLTPNGERLIEAVMETGLFRDKLDAAKFAMALAIRDHEQPAPLEKTSTIWNVGSFDSEDRLKQIVPLLVPGCDEPYRAIESLIEKGLVRLEAMRQAGPLDLAQMLRENSGEEPAIA